MADIEVDGRWLTFADLAKARGISLSSAWKLVRRQKWRKQAGNDTVVRVFVPADALDRPSTGTGSDRGTDRRASPRDGPRDDQADMQRAISVAEAALVTLREQLERERSRAERAEAGRDGERSRADALRDQIDALRGQLAARQEVVDAAEAIRRADDTRRALGRLARLKAAWRGE